MQKPTNAKNASTLYLCVARRDEIVTDATVNVQFKTDRKLTIMLNYHLISSRSAIRLNEFSFSRRTSVHPKVAVCTLIDGNFINVELLKQKHKNRFANLNNLESSSRYNLYLSVNMNVFCLTLKCVLKSSRRQ